MYVTCEQCRTTYRIDDGLVKESGIKVRCSRCKFKFFVYTEEKTQFSANDRFPDADRISDRILPTVDGQTESFLGYDDDDFEFSGYDRTHYRKGRQDQYEWNEFDYEPDEFDEIFRPPEQEVVDTEKELPKEDRAFQMAMEIGEQYGWGHAKVKLLARVFCEHGWSLTRNSILRELDLGMTFDEFQLAVEIREIWHSHTEFSIGYSLKGSFGDDSLKYRSVYKNPDWSFCLKIIRKFDSRPDPEEIEQHFLSLYTIWKFSPALQSRHITYYGFIRDIVDGDDASLDMLVWQYSQYG